MYRFIKITPNYLKLLLQETKYNKNLVERHASQPRKRLFIFLTTPLDKEPIFLLEIILKKIILK
jgi:hypothetical protein